MEKKKPVKKKAVAKKKTTVKKKAVAKKKPVVKKNPIAPAVESVLKKVEVKPEILEIVEALEKGSESSEPIKVDKPIKLSSLDILMEEIKTFMNEIRGKTDLTTAQGLRLLYFFTKKTGKVAGSPSCPGCLAHAYKVLQLNLDIHYGKNKW